MVARRASPVQLSHPVWVRSYTSEPGSVSNRPRGVGPRRDVAMTKRVLIVGGGVVGASAAYHLADAGVATLLVDRHDTGHATAAGAGIIAPGTSLRSLPPFFSLAADAARYY